MTFFKKTTKLVLSTVIIAALFSSCKKDNIRPDDNNNNTDNTYAQGWLGTDDASKIPSNINFFGGDGNIPSKYDLTDKFPPIGDQGNYGTCVAWSTGYNIKTALNGMDKSWTANDLSNQGNQCSPKDLFLSIPNDKKGPNCNGTNFEDAFDVMINRGVASFQSVPYSALSDCSQGSTQFDNEASKNKLDNFRKIDLDVNTIKSYIAQNRPVAVGMFVGSTFQSWNSDAVLSSYSQTNDLGGHAMVIVGYDDSKGPNGAFKILNSWSDNWGNNGTIWVDYKFLVSSGVCKYVFVATNGQSDVDPTVDPVQTGGADLIPWNVGDNLNTQGNGVTDRVVEYNVYNVGNETVKSSSKWSNCYLYYNGYNANDYGVILHDYYTNEFGNPGEEGPWADGIGISGNWWTNIDLKGGTGIAETVSGSDRFNWSYTMPKITGYYYLVMMADAFGNVKENNKSNNLFILHNGSGGPVYFQNGQALGLKNNQISGRNLAKLPSAESKLSQPSEFGKTNANAYSPKEIQEMVIHLNQTGKLKKAIQKFDQQKRVAAK